MADDIIPGTPEDFAPRPRSTRMTLEDLIAGIRPPAPNPLADLSSVAGAFSRGEKADRVQRGDWTQNYDELMLRAQQARERGESDALSKLAVTNYLRSGGAPYSPATLSIAGQQRQLPTFGFGPRAISDAQKTGASSLESQLLSRLAPGGLYTPTPVESYSKPGVQERVGSYAGTALGTLGALDKLGILDKIPGLGGLGKAAGGAGTAAGTAAAATGTIGKFLTKAVPVVGAVTGGIGLLKDRGLASNLMSGVSTGASIGSMVPGLGTAVGAGIGALVGALRGIGGGPSAEEKEGRTAASGMRQSLTAGARPSQVQEAGGDPGALLHIMIRDAAIRRGLQPADAEAQASTAVRSLWQAEKSGSPAVQNIGQQLAQFLGR